MAPRLGYLLPTRERIMEGRDETRSLLALADRAESLGFDSVWVGDSLTARPRHEPLALLAAVAGRTRRVALGTAVMLPALRNPVLLAHQVSTLDQISEGRLILGVGIATDVANIRAEFSSVGVPFEQRGARMMELLRLSRALWTGEPVTWNGRWPLAEQRIGPKSYRPGGPPIWLAGSKPLALRRIATLLDGWFPNDPDPARWRETRAEIDAQARAAGRNPNDITGAIYLTLTVDENAATANARLNDYLERYYGVPVIKDDRNVVFEMNDDSQVIAKYLDQKFGLGLFPAELEGLQAILWRYIENDIEGPCFKLTDIHWRELIPASDRLRFIRHKERKFGRGCLDQWRAQEGELLHQLEERLAPFEQMARHCEFLIDDVPRFVDFDLFGMLGDFLFTGHYQLPKAQTHLAKWHRRMERIKHTDFCT